MTAKIVNNYLNLMQDIANVKIGSVLEYGNAKT